jgi:hypothetical protein
MKLPHFSLLFTIEIEGGIRFMLFVPTIHNRSFFHNVSRFTPREATGNQTCGSDRARLSVACFVQLESSLATDRTFGENA